MLIDFCEKRIRAPTVPIASRVGAGDSMVAGILAGLSRNDTVEEAVRYGAAGSAAVMTSGTQLCCRHDVDELYNNGFDNR
ncbi:MAG: hypothetical protein K9N51_06855 [Candidatus Pacebacteria bacterium]|nr:hypothetical protein [Candidatus Paceibacterota bacterium]